MTGLRFARRRAARAAASLAIALVVAGCGDDSTSPDDSGAATLLDASLNIQQGDDCDNGSVSRDFAALAGGRITITVTGPANRNVLFVLYAPDFAQQLGSAQSSQGTARLIVTVPTGGTHHVDVCELDGVATAVRLVVTQSVL